MNRSPSDQPTSNDLLNCPFCGGTGGISGEERVGFYAHCMSVDCYCCVGEGYDASAYPSHAFGSEADAIEAWNKRNIA